MRTMMAFMLAAGMIVLTTPARPSDNNSRLQILEVSQQVTGTGNTLVRCAVSCGYLGVTQQGNTVIASGPLEFTAPVAEGKEAGVLSPALALYQNYPNPFNPTTLIRFQVPEGEGGRALSVQLRVYDVIGREIATLVNGEKEAGTYTVEWDASAMPSGVYYCRLKGENVTEVRRLLLVR